VREYSLGTSAPSAGRGAALESVHGPR
jgi:hypothetical protein